MLWDVLRLSGRLNGASKLPELWLRGAWMRDVVLIAPNIEVGSMDDGKVNYLQSTYLT